MSDDGLMGVDRWVGELQRMILDRAATTLKTIQAIGENNAQIAVEHMGRMQQLLVEQQRITDEMSGISEEVGGKAAASAGKLATLTQAQLDAVNVSGSLGTFLKNLDFFMNENPTLASELVSGLAGTPKVLAETITKLSNQDFTTWYDSIQREAKRRRRAT